MMILLILFGVIFGLLVSSFIWINRFFMLHDLLKESELSKDICPACEFEDEDGI